MADALQSSCAAPVFKRPRLEFSPCKSETVAAFESVQSVETFRKDSALEDDRYALEPAEANICEAKNQERNFNGHEASSHKPNDTHEMSESHQTPEHSRNGLVTIEENHSGVIMDEKLNGLQSTPEFDENDTEDQESNISELSGFSDLSNMSGQDWKPNAGPLLWVQQQMIDGVDPRSILVNIVPKDTIISPVINDAILWRFILNFLTDQRRSKLDHINTLDDAVHLLRTCKKVIVLTGAGVSVSCGIPDFRSKNGVYARLSKDYPDLPDPQAMFDIRYFRKDPRPFFKFAKEIYPGQFKPSPSHHFIKLLEHKEKLLRNYTQNIDTLEQAAGIKNVITCHGSFATASCTSCSYKVESSQIKEEIFAQRIPYCPKCPADAEERGIMKPDIVFFGEGLSDEFHEAMTNDKDICDLLIVIGSSLKVRPVAMIPSSIPVNVPQILINREPLKHLTFDIELLGDCDVIIGELCRRLEQEWTIEDCIPRPRLEEISALPSTKTSPQAQDPVDNCQLSPAELNNNLNSSDIGRSSGSSEWRSSLPLSEESNSCDCRGLSEIKLEDSEDGSNEGHSANSDEATFKDCDLEPGQKTHVWPPKMRESLSKCLPEATYLFTAPNRYIFQGAEVYKDNEADACRSTPTDFSSDCDSPRHLSSDDDDENGNTENSIKDSGSSPSHSDLGLSQSQDHEVIPSTSAESLTQSKLDQGSPKT